MKHYKRRSDDNHAQRVSVIVQKSEVILRESRHRRKALRADQRTVQAIQTLRTEKYETQIMVR